MLIACITAGGGAFALDAPIDPWAEADWQLPLTGLQRSAVRSVKLVEQTMMPSPGGPAQAASTRESHVVFDGDGRVERVDMRVDSRGERSQGFSLAYVWSGSRLLRIDDAGASRPYLQREYDAAGRLKVERKRVGAVERRVEIAYDAAGREAERVTVEGSYRRRESRRYHGNGKLKSLVAGADSVRGKRSVVFDGEGRPTEIVDTDLSSRIVTAIRYPSALVAVRKVGGFYVSKDGVRSPHREVTFRVRRVEELMTVSEPEAPLARRETVDGRAEETQADYDDAGRPQVQRRLDGNGNVLCVTTFRYHASGVPESVRSRAPNSDERCKTEPNDYEYDIEGDERGNWKRLRVSLVAANGARTLALEQRRVVEYR
jgi:hypothetical protein